MQAAPGGPLTPEHLQALALADQRAKKLRSAAGVATFNAISVGAFGVLSLMYAMGELMFGEYDWLGVIMGVGLSAIAWNEFRGRKLLHQFSPRAPAVLGWNQLGLLVLVVAYGAWMMNASLRASSQLKNMMGTDALTIPTVGNIDSLYKTLAVTMYGALIAGTVIFQGLNSLYYFTRARILRDYLAQTPAWVVELQRHQAASR